MKEERYHLVLDAKFGAEGTPERAEAEEKAYAFYTASFNILSSISFPSKCLPTANVERITIITTATRSSTSSISESTGFTEVTSDLYYTNGSLGTLKIPAIGLTVKVYEGTGSSTLAKGAGHFEDTSLWDGNCCIAGHNRGVRNDFGKLHTLEIGDTVTWTTKLGTRTYEVTSVSKVKETDTSGTAPTSDNRLTLYTCVRNQRDYRWCVTAVAK